jgi:hypothetical protein
MGNTENFTTIPRGIFKFYIGYTNYFIYILNQIGFQVGVVSVLEFKKERNYLGKMFQNILCCAGR